MKALSECVREFLAAHLPRPARLGLAVSGGRDSMALMDLVDGLAASLGVTPILLHYDHALRPDSARDALFVRDAARERGLEFHSERADAATGSSEEKLRGRRYGFFGRAVERLGLDGVATGHTADDQAETVLFRILRGTGTRGLAGIPASRPLGVATILRPLLAVRRRAIAQYVEMRGLPFREDPSNASLDYARNRIRHQVLPFLIEHGNPNLVEALCRLAAIAEGEDDFLERSVEAEREACARDGGRITCDIPHLAALHPALRRRLIHALLEECGIYPTLDTADEVAALVESGGRIDLSKEVAAWREEGPAPRLVLGRALPGPAPVRDEYEISLPGVTTVTPLGLRITVTPTRLRPAPAELKVAPRPETSRGPWTARVYLDAGAVRGRLRVRTRREGDRIVPFGMKGTRKLHDIFIDGKVPLAERDRWPLLCDDEGVLWVAGLKQAERTRVGEETRNVLRVEMESTGGPSAEADEIA